jgi:catechol 2,3-dioxygenase-like lactoylglutathione lyase family enzyme
VTVAGLNHISVESADSQALAQWYHSVLGFEILPRPPFPFGGAWLLAAGVTIHIIDRDPEFESGQLPLADARRDAQTADRVDKHRFIRRGHHTALSVPSAKVAEAAILARGMSFTKFTVPATNLTQLFFFDLDGNGIELVGPL